MENDPKARMYKELYSGTAGNDVIFKYRLPIGGTTTLMLPKYAIPIHFDMQDDSPTVWFRQSQTPNVESRTFCIVGTGHPFPQSSIHIGSTKDGAYIWHAIELRPIIGFQPATGAEVSNGPHS